MSLLNPQRGLLAALASRGRLRERRAAVGVDFASNDYLGLAASPFLRTTAAEALARGVHPGAGAARLLRGNDPEIQALEEEAARHFGATAALYLASGYVANLAIFSALPQTRDLVLHDALIHASAVDGLRLSGAEARAFTHNDVTAAADAIRGWRHEGGLGQVWIACESLYSMDGDFAPVADLHALAKAEDCFLIVDEAHATGIWGPEGRGLAADLAGEERVVTLHTCGKALGVAGALICAHPVLIETLVNRARGFIYSTAPSPLSAAIVRGVLSHLDQDAGPRDRLQARVARVAGGFQALGLTPTASQIQPIPTPGDAAALALSAALGARGFDLRAIRSPTVPKGAERLRLSVTLNPDDEEIDSLFNALGASLQAAA